MIKWWTKVKIETNLQEKKRNKNKIKKLLLILKLINKLNLPELNSTIAFKQLYSAESTWSAFNFSTCSWNILIWSIKATTLSAAIGLAWSPAAANSGATCNGIEHWAAFKTNNSLQLSRKRATWSATWRSGKKGIFRAHSTALNNNLAASSQMFSIPIILFGCMHWP